MSAGIKRPLAEAMRDAEDFRDHFLDLYAKWEIAGSIRRKKSEVGDCEHVLVPLWQDVTGDGLFAEPKKVNAVWRRLDDLVVKGVMQRAIYTDKNGAVSQRWGQVYRGVTFNGYLHELYTARPETWGAILCIRTGPDSFSKRVMEAFNRGGCYAQRGGELVCLGSTQAVPVPDEVTYLRLAGVPWEEAEHRR